MNNYTPESPLLGDGAKGESTNYKPNVHVRGVRSLDCFSLDPPGLIAGPCLIIGSLSESARWIGDLPPYPSSEPLFNRAPFWGYGLGSPVGPWLIEWGGFFFVNN